MKKHKLNCYPEMKEAEFERLKESLKTGYRKGSPVVLYQGAVLDGWNRWRGCEELGIKPETQEFTGTDIEALDFVILTNNRRDMDSSVRAAVAVVNDELMEKVHKTVKKERVEKMAETKTGMKYKQEIHATINCYMKKLKTVTLLIKN